MSQFILYCRKLDAQTRTITEKGLNNILSRLTPENLSPNPPYMVSHNGLLIGMLNPVDTVKIHPKAICLGQIYESDLQWSRMHAPAPNGTYALIRFDQNHIEVLADALATRSIWYYYDKDTFIASNSQRAIILLLQSFEPDRETISWMISSGTLGPFHSWDRRISMLPGSATFSLDRKSWKGKITRHPSRFTPEKGSYQSFKKKYTSILSNQIGKIEYDPSQWIFPLSGGYDSRALLMYSDSIKKLQSITWGRKEAIDIPYTDGYIGSQLARHFGISHSYHPIQQSTDTIEKTLGKFMEQGEGRTEGFSAYIDGFQLWEKLFEQGYSGYIRGDQPYAGDWARNVFEVREGSMMLLLEDIDKSKRFLEWGLKEQKIPEEFEQLPGEHIMDWKDRLCQLFSVPALYAPLTFLKSAYLETTNPFFHKKMIDFAYEIPFEIRLKKELFWKIIREKSPNIPFAHRSIDLSMDYLCYSKEVSRIIIDTLESSEAEALLPEKFITHILSQFKGSDHSFYNSPSISSPGMKKKLQAYIPKKYYRKFRKLREYREAEVYQLAFMIVKMHELLTLDAAYLRQLQPEFNYKA
ncbi:MAG: hypothetical protein R3B93_14455 [Bacteroidia bacterium]